MHKKKSGRCHKDAQWIGKSIGTRISGGDSTSLSETKFSSTVRRSSGETIRQPGADSEGAFEAKRERWSWGLSRRKRRIESWSKSHEYKRAIKSDVLVLRSSGDEIEQPGEGIRVVGRGEMKRSPWALIRKKRCLI